MLALPRASGGTQAVQDAVRRIVVVGGGTAGWITASLIAAENRESAHAPEVVLVESPDIPIIGVGEGTWPSMRLTLQKIGLAEADLVRQCEASFKQGTRFTGWSRQGDDCQYVHPFSLPAEYATLNLAEHWLATEAACPFAEFVTPQATDHRGRAGAQAVRDPRVRVQRQLRLSLRRRQVCPAAASPCGRPAGCPVCLRQR